MACEICTRTYNNEFFDSIDADSSDVRRDAARRAGLSATANPCIGIKAKGRCNFQLSQLLGNLLTNRKCEKYNSMLSCRRWTARRPMSRSTCCKRRRTLSAAVELS